MVIDSISAKALASAIQKAGAPSGAPSATEGQPLGGVSAGGGFSDALGHWLDAVNDSAGEANQAVNGMVNGTGDVHTAMIALQRADTMLELTVQVRNKLVAAYQDVMRMPM